MQGCRVGLILHGHVRTVLDQQTHNQSERKGLAGVLPTYISPALDQTVCDAHRRSRQMQGCRVRLILGIDACAVPDQDPHTSDKSEGRCHMQRRRMGFILRGYVRPMLA